MAVEFQMPKLGLTMEEGLIVEWLAADGTEVQQGTAVLVVETDKVDTEIEASHTGVLHITANAGETVACGDRIAWFLAPGEAPPVERAPQLAASTEMAALPHTTTQHRGRLTTTVGRDDARQFASPNARRVAGLKGIDISQLVGTGPGGRVVSEDVFAVEVPDATHAAHLIAKRLNVDLRDVRASGPESRLDRADVERYVREQMANKPSAKISPAELIEAPLLQPPSSTIPLKGMRGTIASRMHASLREMAQLTLTMDAVMDAVVKHRREADPRTRAGYTDYFVAAVAAALVDHPLVNSQIAGGELALLPEINVGLAVALPGGLVVPVVHRTNECSLEVLAAETTRLAAAARAGELSRDDVEGGTFSVTALGMYGVDAFTPVINPPNTAILGVGRLRDEVRWRGDTPTKTIVATLSFTWDHRAFDGVPAAEFTAAVRDYLEQWT